MLNLTKRQTAVWCVVLGAAYVIQTLWLASVAGVRAAATWTVAGWIFAFVVMQWRSRRDDR